MAAKGGSLKIKYENTGVLRAFRKVHRTISDPTGTLRIIGQYITEVIKQSFDNQASPEGVGWSPLTPSTRAWKSKHRYSSKALIRTGKLKRSVGFTIIGRTAVFAGAADDKAPWHQFGTNIGGSARSGGHRVGVPARPFIGLSDAHEARIQRLVEKWIQGRTI